MDTILKHLDLLKTTRTYGYVERDFLAEKPVHAYIIFSEDEQLSYEMALVIAMQAICDKKPCCMECRTCRNIEKGLHPDVCIYPREGNARINVEEVSEILESCNLAGVENPIKVYILKNMQDVLATAQNKLLKVLEEPPEHVIFVLLSVSEAGVLTTVKSRVKQLNIGKFSREKIYDYLRVNYSALGQERLFAAAAVSDGVVSKAERFASDGEYVAIYEDAFEIFRELDHSSKLLQKVGLLLKHEKKMDDILSLMQIVARDALIYKTHPEMIINRDREHEISEIAKMYPEGALIAATELISEAKRKLKFNCGKKAVADSLLISILEVRRKCLL